MQRRISIVVAVASVLALIGALAAQATTATDTRANFPQIGAPTNTDIASFPTNKQNEPTIAVNPMNPANLIAGSNDEQLQPPCGPGLVRGTVPANDCSFFPNVGTDGVYTSNDGGATWTNRGLLPGFTDYGNPGMLISDGDPVVVYGPKRGSDGSFSWSNGQRAYYASLAGYASGQAQGNQAPELLTVSASDDNGVTWSNPVIAAGAHGYTFNDKEAIWADDNSSSPFFGRVYVSWTQFRGIPGCAEPIMTAYSADGGSTWSKPKQLSPSQNCGLGGRQGSTIRTARDGTLYVAWEDSDVNGYKQVVAISKNGGVSFTRPLTIARVTDISSAGDRIPGSNFRVDSFLSLGVDQSSGASSGAVYAAWSDLRSGSDVIVVSKSVDGGRTWSAPVAVSNLADGNAFFQGLDVAPNGRVDLAYQSQAAVNSSTYGGGNAAIDSYYVSSTDGGATWSAPTKVSSSSSDPATSAQNNLARQFWGDYNTLVSTDAAVWFIYTDSRNGAACPAVDAYQHAVDGSGPAAPKPAPQTDCPDQQFGNTDVFVSQITP